MRKAQKEFTRYLTLHFND
uniref:Uncharacterized protein n=1 Tax=Anguilla anguilla TaxID=7936 RepID=A0A0E9UYE2_ANGAN